MAEDVFGIIGSLQVGAFRVLDVVAEGGFGVVYRARHEGFRADVALKCLKIPGTLSSDQKREFSSKFQEEGELLFQLSALIPAIVRPLHVGAIENATGGAFVPFIALEWLEGESLDSLVRRRHESGKPPLDLARAVRLLGPAARGLECAHKFPGPSGPVSVLHRDLKPENLFISKAHASEAIRILDFGLGKVKSAATQIVGRVSAEGGLAAFTPAYAAPEQWLPKRYGQSGTWTDVWGFALTLVEVLIGRPPFEGDIQAVMGTCIDEKQRPTPKAFGVKLSSSVEAAFSKALAVDPRDRYQDIGEFWDVLEADTKVLTPRLRTHAPSHLDSVAPPGLSEGAIPDLVPELSLGARPKPVPVSRPERRKADAVPEFSLMGNDATFHSSGHMQLDVHPMDVQPVAVMAPISVARAAAAHRLPSIRPTFGFVMIRAVPALKLLGLAAALMVADITYLTVNGSAFTLGPVRTFWIAGPLAVYGLFKLAMSVLGE